MSETHPWWKEAVVYQIYPRSFNDTDGDGIGDLAGITAKVEYLDALGVDVVWLNPVYESPMVDNGYDISDYRAIHDEYGTMADWDALRDALHERNIRLVMDLVVNHTSDEHEWFQRSRRGAEPYDEYYHWIDGDPDEPPNNWSSMFGTGAWSYDDEREAWYLHLFDQRMPDLNWRNPAVREDIYEMMRWWFEKDIDGFRLDVINLLSKPEDFPNGDPSAARPGSKHYINGPRIHEYVGEITDRVFADYDSLTIGETVDVTPADARRYVVEDGLDMVFPFDHMQIDSGDAGPWDVADWDLYDLKAVTERWQTALDGGWIGMYLSNHDQPRIVSRFGDDETYRRESATMLATFLFTLRGTPFVYQGQEIGLPNTPFESLGEFRDPATILRVELALQTGDIDAFEEIRKSVNYWSRDNARTPMPWSDDENGGFTDGKPWIKLNPRYPEINVERARSDDGSVWHYYRDLIRLRKEHPVLVDGTYEPLLPDHPEMFVYRRVLGDDEAVVVLNFFEATPTFEPPEALDTGRWSVLVSNYDTETRALPDEVSLRPYEARVYHSSR